MRRLLALVLALLLALTAASALAREAGACCDDGCGDLTLCAAASCASCAAQAIGAASPAPLASPAQALPWRSGIVVTGAPVQRLWRPPRGRGGLA